MRCKGYYAPATLPEALERYGSDPDGIIPAAGGTNLMVKGRERDWYADLELLDLSRIGELDSIRAENGFLTVGALTTIAELLDSPLVREYAPILTLACAAMGTPQIRNKATLGGNLANACPAGDCLPALCVRGAEVTVRAWGKPDRNISVSELVKPCKACLSHREMTVSSCYFGRTAGKKNNLLPGELITEIRIPFQKPGGQVFFQKVGRKAAGCMSRFTLAVEVRLDGERVEDLRLCTGAALAGFRLQEEACAGLIGAMPSAEDIGVLSDRLAEEILSQRKELDENLRYQAEVCRRLCRRTLLRMLRGEES